MAAKKQKPEPKAAAKKQKPGPKAATKKQKPEPKAAAKKQKPEPKAAAKKQKPDAGYTYYEDGKVVKARRTIPEPEIEAGKTREKPVKTTNNWDDPQNLLDNSRSPSDLVVKALLLRQFTDEEIAEMVKSKFGSEGYVVTTTYASDLRSQLNRQTYFKRTLEEATNALGERLPIPRYVRDDDGNLVAKVRKAE